MHDGLTNAERQMYRLLETSDNLVNEFKNLNQLLFQINETLIKMLVANNRHQKEGMDKLQELFALQADRRGGSSNDG